MQDLAQMGRRFKIGFDYDETFTLNRDMNSEVIRIYLKFNCIVKFVTIRYDTWENSDIIQDASLLGIDIIFCNGKQKAECFDADFWVDDSPEMIPTYVKSEGGILIPTTHKEDFE